MNKRGQIFILAALLLGFIIVILVSQTQYTKRSTFEGNFEELNENYERESAKFINELVKNPSVSIDNEFTDFNKRFTAYSKGQNPDFELIYAFDFDETLYVGNYLSKPIRVETKNVRKTLNLKGCFEKIGSTITLGGSEFGIKGQTSGQFKSCSGTIGTSFGKGSDTYPISIQVGDDNFAYTADITVGVPELIIVSREERGQERKVFTKGKFLKAQGGQNE